MASFIKDAIRWISVRTMEEATMKMSHFAQFLLIILGGAARELGGAMWRGFRRRLPQAR